MNRTENLTPEKAVEILKGEGENVSIVRRVNAHKMGVEAIERCMIAKKPEINIGYGYCQVLCPECSGTVLRHYDYCRGCGQKLDWSDAE